MMGRGWHSGQITTFDKPVAITCGNRSFLPPAEEHETQPEVGHDCCHSKGRYKSLIVHAIGSGYLKSLSLLAGLLVLL
jgi:hypothetical protein